MPGDRRAHSALLPDTGRAVVVLGAAALLGACAEGGVAAVGALGAGAGFGAALLAFAGALSLVLVFVLPLAILLGLIADRPSAQALGRGLREGFGGSTAVLVVVAAAVFGGAIAAGTLAGTRFSGMMTAPFAAGATALTTVVAFALLALLGAPLGGLFARLAGIRGRSSMATLIALVGLAIALLAVMLRALPPSFAPAPAAFVLALGVLTLGRVREPFTRALRGARALLAGAVLLGAALAGVASLGSFPTSAQSAVLYTAPWTGNLAAMIWRATDADRDGYSPYLLGGDCDDRDETIRPGARDVPANGLDENCSGADAIRYAPPRPPRSFRPAGLPQRPNIVLLQIDALRPDHLGFAGYERPTSPRLDRFRETATWFENAYTPAPSTRFAMTSMFTGYDARRAPHQDLGGNQFRLDPRAQTVAEDLAPIGYDTLGYTISYVLHHNQGLGQGFRLWDTPWPVDDWERTYPIAAEITTRAVGEYLRSMPEDGSRPFMLFAHYRCTHDPYFSYERWDYGEADVDRYDSALNYCDDEIGKVLDQLDRRGDADRTVIAIFSDHGELFGEHGTTNHGNTLYETDVRILMLLRVPGVSLRSVRVPVSLSDLAPTILELAGRPVRPDLDGWSLLAHLSDDAPDDPAARPLFLFTDLWRANVHIEATAVLRWPYKYIRNSQTGAEELYDVAADPEEADDLAAGQARVRDELAELSDAYEAFAHQP